MTAGPRRAVARPWLERVRHAVSISAPVGSRATLTESCHGHGTMAGMKILNLLHLVVAQAFYRWAMREINPMHPDVPRIMQRQRELAEKYHRIWA